MNIQIFGTNKSFDTKKAQRWFKERRIKFQMVDLKEKGLSRGEFDRVCQAVGGWQALVDETAKDQDTLALLRWLDESQQADKLFENQQLLRQPIVRNGRKATVGYQPDRSIVCRLSFPVTATAFSCKFAYSCFLFASLFAFICPAFCASAGMQGLFFIYRRLT